MTLARLGAQRVVRVSGRALLLVLASAWPATAGAWSRPVHQSVHGRAIDGLPRGLKTFFERHRLELATFSPDAKLTEEGPERRFAADRLVPFPFADLPHAERDLQARFGERSGEVGRLPWLIQESYARLVQRLRQKDKVAILEEADLLAALVTDLHNPLALTENYDGQRSGQSGLWARFAVRLPELLVGGLKLDADAGHLIDDPHAYVFSMLNATYVWADNVLYEDDFANRSRAGYTTLYYELFAERVHEIVRRRLGWAARNVSSYWYSAWAAAGRPELE
jgi:hypothetical protein